MLKHIYIAKYFITKGHNIKKSKISAKHKNKYKKNILMRMY